MEKKPQTLQEAIQHYSDQDVCISEFASMRWPDGPVCPHCDGREHYHLKTQRRWKCKACRKQFSVKVGSIFEDSPLGLDKWMTAAWLIANCKNGISSYEVARALGVTQKSAWFMLHRLRFAMQTGSFMKLGGGGNAVEVDETFIGGKARNMHLDKKARRITGTGGKDKTVVMGILERGGKVRASVISDRRKKTLQAEIKKHVRAGSALYSDELLSYEGLAKDYAHAVINHAVAYVDGKVHTNGMENFWSLLKRGINGTYVSVEPFHIFRYLDEQTFRYNNRKDQNDADRFAELMSNAAGRRLTYSELTGKVGETSF